MRSTFRRHKPLRTVITCFEAFAIIPGEVGHDSAIEQLSADNLHDCSRSRMLHVSPHLVDVERRPYSRRSATCHPA